MGRDADKILRIPGAQWVPDSSATHCMSSKCPKPEEGFGLLRRRHHCRDCGKVYCDQCAPARPNSTRRCAECFLPMCFIPVRFPVFVRRQHPAAATGGATSKAAAAAAAALAAPEPDNPFEDENRRMKGVAGYYVLGNFSGAVVDNIMSFMDFKELNALLQTCKRAQSRFHVRGLRYEANIQDRFPSYWTQARIGDGGGGVVFKVRDPKAPADRTGFVALKVVRKNIQYGFAVWKRLRTEIDLQLRLDHPNIAKLLDVFQTPDEVVLVIEAGDGGSLRKVFEALRSNHNQISWFTATVLKGCAQALIYLRSMNIAHRDIKCDNIVFSEDFSRVLMIDYGLAERVTSDRQPFTPCLSKAMELLTDRGWVDYDAAKQLYASNELVVAGYAHQDLSARPLTDTEHGCIIYERPTAWIDNPDDAKNPMYQIFTDHATVAAIAADAAAEQIANAATGGTKTVKSKNDNERHLHIEVTGNHGIIVRDTTNLAYKPYGTCRFKYVTAAQLAAGKWPGIMNKKPMDGNAKRELLTAADGGVGYAGACETFLPPGDLESLFPGGTAALEEMLPALRALRAKAGDQDKIPPADYCCVRATPKEATVRARERDDETKNNTNNGKNINRPLGTPSMGLKDGEAATNDQIINGNNAADGRKPLRALGKAAAVQQGAAAAAAADAAAFKNNNNRPLGTPSMGLKDGDAATNNDDSDDDAVLAIGDEDGVIFVEEPAGKADAMELDDYIKDMPVAAARDYIKRKFLFYLGFWLGDGTLLLGVRDAYPGVGVAQVKANDIQLMLRLMKLFGLKQRKPNAGPGDFFFYKETTSNKVVFVIERPSWVNFFFSNWGYKYETFRKINPSSAKPAIALRQQCFDAAVASAVEFTQLRLADYDNDLERFMAAVLVACNLKSGKWLRRWMLQLGIVYARELLWGLVEADGKSKNKKTEKATLAPLRATIEITVGDAYTLCGYADGYTLKQRAALLENAAGADARTAIARFPRTFVIKDAPAAANPRQEFLYAITDARKSLPATIDLLDHADLKRAKANCVWTSSFRFRDQVMHLAVICGYTTYAKMEYLAGAQRGHNAGLNYSITANHDCWAVNFCTCHEVANPRISKNDVRPMTAAGAASAGGPPVYTGGSWCVTMPHGNIIVRRKQVAGAGGLDTMPRPMIIKNCGTVGFASPENIAAVAERRSKFYAGMDVMHKADMFSLGVVAFMMLSSTKPFKGSRFPEMHREVQAGLRCEGRGWGHVSSAAKALVEKMLRADPATRTSAEDVLEDPWVEEGCRRFMEVVERRREELAKVASQEKDDWVMPSFERVSKAVAANGSPKTRQAADGSTNPELPQEGASEGCWLFEGEVVGAQFRPVA